MIQTEIPDWKERLFYLSGPHAMVVAFEKVLRDMGVASSQIKIDFFPGFV
jgi:ferredoxin-NADP reductase